VSNLEIIRFADHPKLGCPGDLYVDGIRYCSTLEQPWVPIDEGLGGKPYESCVPTGEYKLVKYHSKKYGDCFLMVSYANEVHAFEDDMLHQKQRFGCIFAHRGSYVNNFQGCIGLGVDYKLLGEEMGITKTRFTCEKLMHLFYQDNVDKLTIRWKHA